MAEKNLEEMREAVETIREKMAAAAREAGRDPAEVQLCAACKTRTADTVAASAALAIDVFGENHVQELCANYDAGAYCGKPSHFIGHLQTNKIKKVLGRASLIQSVDSEHLLAAIEKEAAKAGIVQDVLLRLFHSDCNLDRIDDVERYLWRAIANRCCDYHRHRRNATLPTERAAALADDSGDQELREEYERIAGLLATLPEEQAEVIRLKTSDSLTFARIAELTGSTEATVKSRFRYGIGKLRKLINH